MRIKRRRASIKTTSPDLTEGQFLVYPSTFTRTPDSYGDVVAKGAFTDTIAAWLSSEKTLPGLYGHRMDDPDYYVASAIDMGEDDYGWWITGQFDMDSPKGPQVYRLVKDGRLNELSFAFDVLDEGRVKLDDGREVNELRKLDVHEFSFVPLGA
ncbi:MAG: HK97 family phage prohead protease, partial [Pseudoclavibacter sp.]|nr:HK97 family phage prohead protease [Pseudoclavibacter sp.]